MYDYGTKPTPDGDIRSLGVWHQAALKIFNFKGKKVLDVGCGTGSFLSALQGEATSVMGIDPNPLNTSVLQTHNIPTITGYLEDHMDEAKDHDTITCFEVVEHLYSPNTLIKSAYDILPSGGTLIVTTPNAFHFIRTLLFSLKQEHHDPLLDPSRSENPEHIRLWSLPMLERTVAQAGFETIHSYGTVKIFGKIIVLKMRLFVKYFSQHLIVIGSK